MCPRTRIEQSHPPELLKAERLRPYAIAISNLDSVTFIGDPVTAELATGDVQTAGGRSYEIQFMRMLGRWNVTSF